MPESLAALNLVQSAARSFAWSVYEMYARTQTIGSQLLAAKSVYEVGVIPNEVVDGTVTFPETTEQVRDGIGIEFRYISTSMGEISRSD